MGGRRNTTGAKDGGWAPENLVGGCARSRASQICAAALFELKSLLEKRAPTNRPSAVGGAPSGDHSLLPSLLAQMVLIEAGWDAVNLGPDTPFASFAKAIADIRPRLLWLS